MAKTSGLGNSFWIDGIDIGADVMRLDELSGGPGLWVTTAITQSAVERQGVTRTGTMNITAFFNPSASQAHPTLDTLPRTDRIATYLFGTTTGSAVASMVCKEVTYNTSRGTDGSLVMPVECQSNGFGLDFGVLLTNGKRTDTAATNGSGVDNSAGTSHGLQAYLHVFSFTGTSVTVKLQHSNDDAATDPYADVTGGAFTAATAVGAQRIATGDITIKRWLRVVTTGTFNPATFAVSVNRNNVTTTF